jgi:hypothetical protein
MTELAAGYTTEDFPYAPILGELTDVVRENSWSPVEAYLRFLDMRDKADLSPYFDYGSTAISTAGHARNAETKGLSMSQIIAANTDTARQLAGLMHKQGTLEGPELVLPVDLGNTGWTQSQFMEYWGLTIPGPDLRELRKVEGAFGRFERNMDLSLARHGVDLTIMNNSRLERNERRQHYVGFISAFAEIVEETDVVKNPARRFIKFVDTAVSLGTSAEDQLAREMDINRYEVAAVKPATLDEAVPMSTLREDMRVIMALGGSVLVAPKGAMLTLVRDTSLPD